MSGDFIDDTHAAIVAFAEQFLEEDERDSFVDSLMERHGYQRMSSWGPPEPQQQQGQRSALLKAKGAGQGRQQQGGQQGQQQGGQGGQQGARSYFGRGTGR